MDAAKEAILERDLTPEVAAQVVLAFLAAVPVTASKDHDATVISAPRLSAAAARGAAKQAINAKEVA